MYGNARTAFAFLASAVLLVGCDAAVPSVENASGPPADGIRFTALAPGQSLFAQASPLGYAPFAGKLDEDALGCYFSSPNPGASDAERYRVQGAEIAFPADVLARAGGHTRIVVLTYGSEVLYAETPRTTPVVVRKARCVIPDDDEAVALVKEALNRFDDAGALPWEGTPMPEAAGDGGEAKSGSLCTIVIVEYWTMRCHDGTCTHQMDFYDMEIACGDDDDDDPDDTPDPDDGGGVTTVDADPCEASETETGTGVGMPSADGEGLGCVDPDPDPCEISDPEFSFLNTTSFAQGAQLLWDVSNADAPLYEDRQETVGVGFYNDSQEWTTQAITQDHFYSLRSWDTARGPAIPASNFPSGAVHIHTHPFQPGETYRESETRLPVRYETGVSESDRRLLAQLGYEHGIYLDKTYIVVYDRDGEIVRKYDRCGY